VFKNGRCDEDQFQRLDEAWSRKDGSRYESSLARSLILFILQRDGYVCKNCGHFPSNQVDHIIPKFMGGYDNLDNLQTLCKTCHGKKSSIEGHAAQRMKRDMSC
jgi:5-methylcytosine-specific restriction protein A